MGPDRPRVTTKVGPHGTWLVNLGANFMFSNMGPGSFGVGWVLGPHGFGAASTGAASTGAGGVVGPERP